MRVFLRAIPAFTLVCATLMPAGCGQPTGSVKGTITVGGQPLTRGLITFIPEGGNRDPYSGAIIDGKYEIPGIPTGKARICIINSTMPPQDAPGGGNDLVPTATRKRGFTIQDIPAKYHDPEQSGLEIDVGPGVNTFDKEF